SVTDLNATLTIDTGVHGTLSGTVALSVPGVEFGADLDVDIDTRTGSRHVRVQGTQLHVTIAGQELTGDFVVEQGVNAAGEQVVKAAVQPVTLSLGTFVNVTSAEGQLVVSSHGVAGSFTVSGVTVTLPGVGVDVTTVKLAINTTTADVTEAFTIAGTTSTL